jgi:hypothetical protein
VAPWLEAPLDLASMPELPIRMVSRITKENMKSSRRISPEFAAWTPVGHGEAWIPRRWETTVSNFGHPGRSSSTEALYTRSIRPDEAPWYPTWASNNVVARSDGGGVEFLSSLSCVTATKHGCMGGSESCANTMEEGGGHGAWVFLYVRCVIILESDSVVEDPNLFEEDPHDTFEQGKWISPSVFFCRIPYNTFNKVYFWICA